MNRLFFLLIATALFSCSDKKQEIKPSETIPVKDTVAVEKAPDKTEIIPGQTIGHISLEQNASVLDSILGKPDFSDAAMGKAWTSWYSKEEPKNELNIYTTYKDSEMKEKVVRQIRITSPKFETAEGISTGKTVEEIQKIYPDLKLVATYKSSGNQEIKIYDVVKSGIAFETENNKCIAIIIHTKDKNVTEEYITFHPDMTRI